LNSNTHAGQGIREGGLKKCAEELDVDIVVVQEVGRVLARRGLRRAFPRSEWGCFGFNPPIVPGWVGAGNHVLWRKELFEKLGGSRDLLSTQVWLRGGRRDKWHPVRRLGQVRLRTVVPDGRLHNGTKRKLLAVGSDHLWTTAGHSWEESDHIVRGHRLQARAQARVALSAQGRGFDVIHMGDQNEPMAPGDSHTSYMEGQYKQVGMKDARRPNAAKTHLDSAFVSQRVSVVSYDIIPKHLLTTDHDGILLVVDI
jgi:hypothetical protein